MMLKAFALALALLAGTGAELDAPPKPKPTAVATEFVLAGDTVKMTARVYMTGALAASDDIRWQYQRNDTTKVAQFSREVVDSARVGHVEGSTYRVCSAIRRNGTIVNGTNVCSARKTFSMPVPVIDSVKIVDSLKAVSAVPGQVVQFAAVVYAR